jgi:hypothetical protein
MPERPTASYSSTQVSVPSTLGGNTAVAVVVVVMVVVADLLLTTHIDRSIACSLH